jgi:hypothetical protein
MLVKIANTAPMTAAHAAEPVVAVKNRMFRDATIPPSRPASVPRIPSAASLPGIQSALTRLKNLVVAVARAEVAATPFARILKTA